MLRILGGPKRVLPRLLLFHLLQEAGRDRRAAADAGIKATVGMQAIFLLAVFLVSLVLNSCVAEEGPRWKKIAEGEGYNKEGEWTHGPLSDFVYVGHEPRLIVITDKVAVPALQDRVLPSHLRRIAQTSFTTNWVAVIYQGFKCRPGYHIQVSTVEREANTVTIHAQFHQPTDPEDCYGQPDTSPYYVLRIRKPDGLDSEDVSFILDAGGQSVSETCALRGEYVPWSPLVNDPEAEGQYEGRSPRLAIVSSQDDVASVESDLLSRHREQLSEVDYSKRFAVIVYQGRKSTTGYLVEVIRVIRHQDTIYVCSQFHEPRLGQPVGGMVTSPYYILQVEKSETLGGEFTFVLTDNQEELIRQTEIIP
jgi:hypothetical protein